VAQPPERLGCPARCSPAAPPTRWRPRAWTRGARASINSGVSGAETPGWGSDRELVSRILAGDDAAFTSLIDALHRPLARIAEAYVGRGPAVDDLLQDTWAAVIDHLRDYEGRAALRTWITRILVNRAATRRERERRFVSLETEEGEEPEARFSARGFWAAEPAFAAGPEEALLRREASGWLVAALEALPPLQKAVVTLRDVEEWSSEEVCNALELSESNQRVLLHRGRQRLRAALEERVRGSKVGR
jgi:RNA polymerase sigma-70 factor, ECF subfamily